MCVCVLFSLWRLGQRASGVLKDRGIIGQAKERKTWDWSERGIKEQIREALIINPNKHNTGTDTREMCRDPHTQTASPVALGFFLAQLQMCSIFAHAAPPQESRPPDPHRSPPHPLPPSLSLHPNTQRRPTKRIGPNKCMYCCRRLRRMARIWLLCGLRGPFGELLLGIYGDESERT